MSITPVFDATVKASDPDLHKASSIFPQPSTHWSVATQYLVRPNPVDDPTRAPWALTDPRYYGKVTGEFPKDTRLVKIFAKPEPNWRTFLRCLFWWLP